MNAIEQIEQASGHSVPLLLFFVGDDHTVPLTRSQPSRAASANSARSIRSFSTRACGRVSSFQHAIRMLSARPRTRGIAR